MDFKLELVLIPVTDVDRAKQFYAEKCGFTLDVDHQPNDAVPRRPADAAGIGLLADVRDRDHRRGARLLQRHAPRRHRYRGGQGRARRPRRRGQRDPAHDARRLAARASDPEHSDYYSFADFSDPDGNTWVLQESNRFAT